MDDAAVILAHGLLRTPFAKTTHGLVRGPSRFRLAGVIDPEHSGQDAGQVLDGKHRNIPVFASLPSLVEATGRIPGTCIVGVATAGGALPTSLHASLLEAAGLGMMLINGLHQLLEDDPEIASRVAVSGGRIIDLRKPKPHQALRFWTGDILDVSAPRIAVLGTDCAVGKRTTASLLVASCRRRGLRAEMVYTGQTGWLQGISHGFILDATPNDFVCGELEGAILACQRDCAPELIFLEGQSGLRNPSGPCGSELVLAAASRGVVLQHAPGRRCYEGLESLGWEIPPVAQEIALLRLLGSEVWALTLNDESLDRESAARRRQRLATELKLPVVFPLQEGVEAVTDAILRRVDIREAEA